MFALSRARLFVICLCILAATAIYMYTRGMSYANDSVYKDPSTNLMWMRCSIGQTWTNGSCTGEAIKMSWQDAMDYPSRINENNFAGQNNWRLPTISELITLRRCRFSGQGAYVVYFNSTKTQIPYCDEKSPKPTINTDAFPNTRDDNYWSFSSVDDLSTYAWFVGFRHGGVGSNNKYNNSYVRLVRSDK